MDGLTVSVAAIAAVGVAVASAIRAFRAGEEKGKQQRTKIEPTPLPVSFVADLATKDELRELEGRLVAELKKLEFALTGERSVARVANGNLHARIDKVSEGLAATTATMGHLNTSLNRVLDLLLSREPAKPHPRRTP